MKFAEINQKEELIRFVQLVAKVCSDPVWKLEAKRLLELTGIPLEYNDYVSVLDNLLL